jgi:hypothetical protein
MKRLAWPIKMLCARMRGYLNFEPFYFYLGNLVWTNAVKRHIDITNFNQFRLAVITTWRTREIMMRE